nr:hypothetical protein CFP56_26421 [Quercus suber]
MSLESSHTGLSRDEPMEDLFGSKSSELSSEVGSPSYASVSVEMEVGAAKKNKRVQEAVALVAATIKEGKL